jgi:KaiC/GvpD/RAD55 family RecA-like ATPase
MNDTYSNLINDDEDLGPVIEDETEETPYRPSNINQHTLLSYLAANYDVWCRAEPIVKSVYFDEEYKQVVDYLIEHSEEYKQIPSTAIIRMKTGVLLDRHADSEDERTTAWLLDEIQTFCRHRATAMEIKRASQIIQNDASREALEEIFKNLKDITEISLEKDLGIEVHRDARAILSTKQEEITKPTGYKHLDLVTGGGFPKPGLILFAGSSGIGKSVMLTNFGVQYCSKGDFVVYISLELDEKRIFQRVSSIMTDIDIRNINFQHEEVASHLEYRIGMGDGIFRIKKMKMSGTTTSHINAYLKELWIREGRKPDVLILDYLDLLSPKARIRDAGNIHIRDKYTTEETYDLLKEWDLLGITASQMVKNNSELDDFDHASVAGGTPKINTSDYVIALRRKETELWGKIQKGRYGGEGTQIPFDWNEKTLKITDGTDEVFYDKNPRRHPSYHIDQGLKTAAAQKSELNKDVRRAQGNMVLEKIKQKMSHSILEDDSDPF